MLYIGSGTQVTAAGLTHLAKTRRLRVLSVVDLDLRIEDFAVFFGRRALTVLEWGPRDEVCGMTGQLTYRHLSGAKLRAQLSALKAAEQSS